MEVIEWDAPLHSAVQEGSIEEAPMLGGGGGKGIHLQGIQRLWSSLEMMTSFRYLVRVILEADENWPAVVRKLFQERATWKRMTRILSREGAEPWVSGFFFKDVV